MARHLGFRNGQELRSLIDSDPEIKQTWDNARHSLFIQIRQSLHDAAEKGSGYAVRMLSQILRDEGKVSVFNSEAVTTQQLAELSGRTRQTIHQWHTRHKLPRNPDGTFNLTDFIFWFEQWILEKVRKGTVR